MTTSTMSIGGFSFSSASPRWTWSDGMFTLHGMEPGEVVPTRELFLSHVHPEDRNQVSEVLDAADGQPHGCAYRLVDLGGQVHQVLLASAVVAGGDAVSGFVLDDSERERLAVSAEVNAELQVALESHTTIDQAKGMLMLVYGIDGDAAFEVLRWASQQRNVRLRALAERLLRSVLSVGGMGPKARGAVDELVVAAMDDVRLPSRGPRTRGVELELDPDAPCPVLRVRGRVDVTSMAELATALGTLLTVGRERGHVVVDVSGVEEVGAVARFVVQAAQRRSAARDIAMEVVGGAPVDATTRRLEPDRRSVERGRQTLAGHP